MEFARRLCLPRTVLAEADGLDRALLHGRLPRPTSPSDPVSARKGVVSSSIFPALPSSCSPFRSASCISSVSYSLPVTAGSGGRFCPSRFSAFPLSPSPSPHPASSPCCSTRPYPLAIRREHSGVSSHCSLRFHCLYQCISERAVGTSHSVSPAHLPQSRSRRIPSSSVPAALAAATTAGVTRLHPFLGVPGCCFSSSYLPKASIRRNRIPFQLFATPRVSRLSEVSKANREAAEATALVSHMSSPFTLQKQQRLLSLLPTQPTNYAAGSAPSRGIPGVCGLAKFHPSSPPDESRTFRGRVLPQLSTHRVQHLGRNATGQITVRYRGAGHFRRLRFVDFKRGRKDIFATVLRLEYDPCRSAHLALLQYDDGVLSYILASEATRPGDRVVASEHAAIAPGNALPLKSIPVSTIVYNVELRPGAGGQMIRAAGCYATVIAKDAVCATLRLQSTEVRRVPLSCWAVVGQVSNAGQAGRIRGKAGVSYWMGERPRTRGKAMNAVDHPHGGGTGKKGLKRPPVTKWGILCRGYKTRSKKKPLGMIVRRKRPNKLIKKFGELGA